MVIVKFTNRWIKDRLFELQDDLKKSGISIHEQLTDFTLDILSSAQTEFGDTNVSVHKTLVRAQVNGVKHTFRSPGDVAKVVAKQKKQTSGSTPPISLSPSAAPSSNHDEVSNVTSSSPPPPSGTRRSNVNLKLRSSDRYMQVLNAKNNPGYQHNQPLARGFPSRNGRGGHRTTNNRIRYDNRSSFNYHKADRGMFFHSHGHVASRPPKFIANSLNNRQKFCPHPDFAGVNRYGSYYC